MDALTVHRELLESWRRVMDLVGPGPVDEHFVDAEGALRGLNARGAWLDLGSGAGFPGVMLAARHPEARVTLVERRQKRVAFLREVAARTRLPNLEVFEGDSATLARSAWDGVVSRAYKPPAEYLAEAATLLVPGGTAVLLAVGEAPEGPPELHPFHVERYRVGDRERLSVRYQRR